MATQWTLAEWLDDLCVRFLNNLPEHELAGFDRMGGHIEEAHWFYEDWIQPRDSKLPNLSLKNFSIAILQRCPFTSHCPKEVLEQAFLHWKEYKRVIPVAGLILLNDAMDSVLLVRGWSKSASWMFPRGKVDEDEDDLACAVRETYEETGFDAISHGLIPKDGVKLKKLEQYISEQKVMLFIVPNVPTDFPFGARVRKEIGDIKWYKLTELPGWGRKRKAPENAPAATKGLRAFQITPFIGELGRWIKEQRKIKVRSRQTQGNGHISQAEIEDILTEEEEGMATEGVPEALPVQKLLGGQEAATRELHKLLNIQLPPQGSQATHSMLQSHLPDQQPQLASFGGEHDKGKTLLALLKQKSDTPQQLPPVAHLNLPNPHIPLDQLNNVGPQPQTPQHHITPQRPRPQSTYQTPPAVPIPSTHTDINSQLLSFLGVSKSSLGQEKWQQAQTQNHEQTLHHQQIINTQVYQHRQDLNPRQALNQQQAVNQQQLSDQQRAMALASAATTNLTPLAHPQPQPRQANHILGGAVPSPAGANKPVQIPQQNHFSGSTSGPLNLPQQLVANLPKRSDVLDNAQMALLSAFKKGASAANGTAPKSQSLHSPAIENARLIQQQQQQSVDVAVLGSPYTGEPRAHLAMQNGVQGTQMSHISPQLAMAQAALRPRKATPSQQNALLNIFSQPSSSSPRPEGAQPNLKENGAPHLPGQSPGQQQRSSNFNVGPGSAPTMSTAPLHGNNLAPLPYGAQRIAVRPMNVQQKTPQLHAAPHSAQQLGAFRVDGASSDSRPPILGSPITSYVGGSPYNNTVSPAQTGLRTPLPPNHQANPQQQQALLSLFGKSSVAATAPLLQAEERRPASRNQPPISPENERFLLNYLKGVTDSAQ